MKEFLSSAINRFTYYRELGLKAINQLPEEKLFWQYNPESNSIAIIVNHLHGNMLSRWTDFLHSDGEKSWRERDAEFENRIHDKKELLQKWNEGWNCLFSALQPLQVEDLNKKVKIRGEEHSVIDAINRQLTHYAYHIGQIVFLAKMIKNADWQSLSIPKGQSRAWNEAFRRKTENA